MKRLREKGENKMELRTKDQKAIEQSKLTDNYVICYFCAMWSTGGQNNGHDSGYALYRNGKHFKVFNSLELHDFKKNNKTELILKAQEIRKLKN